MAAPLTEAHVLKQLSGDEDDVFNNSPTNLSPTKQESSESGQYAHAIHCRQPCTDLSREHTGLFHSQDNLENRNCCLFLGIKVRCNDPCSSGLRNAFRFARLS